MLATSSSENFGMALGPIDCALSRKEPFALAFITATEGPSYRPLGAYMVLFQNGEKEGTLSSGCIEGDLAHHAEVCLSSNSVQTVRYGKGSPYFDIQLPCGGGLEITMLPNPSLDVLTQLSDHQKNRTACTLEIDLKSGELLIQYDGETQAIGNKFLVRFTPQVRFLIFGKGPETTCFAALVNAAGYPSLLLSPDEETRLTADKNGSPTRSLSKDQFPDDLDVDAWSAIVLFFHDHEWEPPILKGALASQAFYIGAQGSLNARNARAMEMMKLGVDETTMERIRGPIGLVPSARDARTLAVSVLAEVLAIQSKQANKP